MNEIQEKILNEIKKYYQKNMLMPTVRYLQKLFNYHSTNSIYKHLKELEKNGFLLRNKDNKLIVTDIENNDVRNINVINSKDTLRLLMDNNKKYLAYKIKNDYFINNHICKGDTLIIEKRSKLNNNDLGLFFIDNKYQVLYYYYKNGFYILKGNEEIILNKIKIIGKVVMIERKIKTLV